MRSIKFRGWDGIEKKMLEPQDLSQSCGYWKWLGKYDVPLMQFTGLVDKRGKEIYEGDIVKDGGGYYYAVTFVDGCFFASDGDDAIEEVGINPTDWEVAGNVYENPELLK